MDKQEYTIAKFQICSEIEKSTLEKWATSDKFMDSHPRVNILEFKKILLKNDMEEYTALLIGYLAEEQTNILFNQKFQPKFQQFNKQIEESLDYTKELADTLHFLLRTDAVSVIALKIYKKMDVKEIKDAKIIASIIKAIHVKLLKDFKKKHGNIDLLTIEEARAEIISQKDPEWVSKWNREHFVDGTGTRIIGYENIDNTKYKDAATGEDISGEAILNFMIEDYASEHETEREVTLDYLEKVKTRDLKQKGKRGAPEKYSFIKPIMQVLADLRRAEKLYRTLDKSLKTNNFRLTNSDYRFINDCLVLWGLKDDIPESRPITTTKEKALRGILDPSDSNFLIDKYPKLISLRPTP